MGTLCSPPSPLGGERAGVRSERLNMRILLDRHRAPPHLNPLPQVGEEEAGTQPLCRRSQRRRRDIFVATPFPDGFKLRRSEIEYAAPTELGWFNGVYSTKMPRQRRSNARRPAHGVHAASTCEWRANTAGGWAVKRAEARAPKANARLAQISGKK